MSRHLAAALIIVVSLPFSAAAQTWQQGFDFRATAGYVTDPPDTTYVLGTTAYPTIVNGVSFGWANTALVQAINRSTLVDPRLAGINYARDGSPAKFYVDLPSAGTYNLSLAMGDEGYTQCWIRCQIQFLDGNTVVATVTGGQTGAGYFYDALGNNWSAAAWAANNLPVQVTMSGTRLTVVVGSSVGDGYITPIAYLGVTQTSASPDFTMSASPAALSVAQGNQGSSTITTAISGGFDSAISLTSSGAPVGTTVSFNPSTIPAPGAGTSQMNITVGSSTTPGTYPITVTGNGGGKQHNATVTLTVTSSSGWQQGFDFRATSGFVTDPPQTTYVLQTTSYPTIVNGVSFGWANTSLLQGINRSTLVDPRLAGINYARNASAASFYLDLPSAGTYDLSLAMGDDGYTQCWNLCQIQFFDGSTVVATVMGGRTGTGYFYDALGNNWSAATWSASNLPVQVTMSGTRLTMVVGTSVNDGYITPVAYLGVAQITATPRFTVTAVPSALTITQGNQGGSTITTAISGGFNSAITLTSSGAPAGTTVSFNPSTIPAPGSGTSAMTITVGSTTTPGTYPITVIATGGGIRETTTVTLTVTMAAQPDFTLTAAPTALTIAQGNQGSSTITTTVSGGFNGAISLTSSRAPAGTTVSFNPSTILAPGAGTSQMNIMVGSSTTPGTYPITVTGNGGGEQHNATVTLTVTSSSGFQQGFDFRATSSFVTDPPETTYVLQTTSYPTIVNGVSFGWTNTGLVQGINRSTQLDPRLAGINYSRNGSPASFYVDLPSAGTYNLSLAMGDDGYNQCFNLCQIQFFDGNTVVATVDGGLTRAGYFYDALDNNWPATTWPMNNLPVQVTITGTRLTMVVGTSVADGYITPIAYLGVTQTTATPNFTVTAAPAALTIAQENQGSSTITTTISGGFNSAINLTSSGAPAGTTVSFNPSTMPAPGAGTSAMTITVGSSTTPGTYPITVTGTGGGVRQTTTLTLTVTLPAQPDFTLTATPAALTITQGNQGSSTITTAIIGGFNSAINLTSSGAPAGTTVSFNPSTIPAPGAGTSAMTITVGSSTTPGTYPITVTGTGGGKQHNATVALTVITPGEWQQGFDFRGTSGYVTDPPGDSYVLYTTLYPTTGPNGAYGWENMAAVEGLDRSTTVDPRLAGINYVDNGSPGAFYLNLPSPGTYNISLAMGDAGYAQCGALCQVQFLDGNNLLATVTGGPTRLGYFYDALGNNWSAGAWPASNLPLQVTLTGTQLTVLLGTSNNNGNITPIAYLGVAQISAGPTFALIPPSSLSVGQGQFATADVSTALIGSFNSSISLSATGAPGGTTITFNPATLPAPGAGTSIMTVTVPATVPLGTYPVTLTARGGGVVQNATMMLTVTAPAQPDFTLTVPSGIAVATGSQGSATVTTEIVGSFNDAVALSATGAPVGASVSFSPSSIPAPGAGSSTMTITVGSSTRLGSYPIAVTGTGGGTHHTVTTTLTVSAKGNVNLPAGTGWLPLSSQTIFCNASPGITYYNPTVGEVDAFDFLSLCEEGTMVAYSGGAADTFNDRYLLWTSGHNNYQGNEMYELNLRGNGPLVSRITDPAWTVDNTDVPSDCACKGTNNCGQGMWHDGAGNPVATPYREANYDGPHFESTPAPDGSGGQPSCGYGSAFQPNARETYSGLVYHSGTNLLYSWGGVVASDPAAGGAFSNWSLDLNQNPPKWTRLTDSSYTWYTAATYDYTTGHLTSGHDLIFDEQQNLYAYNSATDHYTLLSNSIPVIGNNANIELDPLHHYAVLENGDNLGGYHLKIVNLDSCNGTSCTVTNLDNQASCQGALGYWAGLAWDSKRSVMAIFPSSTNCTGPACLAPFNTAFLLNTDPSNPVTVTYHGVQQTIPPQQCFAASYGSTQGHDYPPMSVGPGVYSRFKYYPNEDIYLFIQHPDEPVWILRLE